MVVDNGLEKVDDFVRLGTEERHPQHLVGVGIDDCLEQSVGLSQHLSLGDGHSRHLLRYDVESLLPRLRLGESDVGEGRGGEHGCGHGPPVVAGSAAIAEELAAHDAVVVERDVGKLRTPCHVAHGPDVGCGV